MLTKAEQRKLARHGATINDGFKLFVQVGKALAAIRDRRLCRATRRTFEADCN